eukprot:scaffold1245_cov252-Pinguiococcus_pyrenoidosus.AAC.9
MQCVTVAPKTPLFELAGVNRYTKRLALECPTCERSSFPAKTDSKITQAPSGLEPVDSFTLALSALHRALLFASATAGMAAPPANQRGAFIVFEGVDRSGKSTNCARVAARLSAQLKRFPDRSTGIGTMINGYLAQGVDLDDRAVHLLFSANRWECAAGIREALAQGQHVVCDRYAYSGVAFSASKEGLTLEW